MTEFPEREEDILELAERIAELLEQHPEELPDPPGEVRDVTVGSQGDTSVVLEWWPPADGGPAASYTVQRKMPRGAWEDVVAAVDNDCPLSDQPRGIEFDLRVFAVNKAGAGPPSEIVTVVL